MAAEYPARRARLDKSAYHVGMRLEGGTFPGSESIYGQPPRRPVEPAPSLDDIRRRLEALRKKIEAISRK